MEDALEKLQEILDAGWKAVQPIEEDPEKAKQLQKQLERGNERRLLGKKFQVRGGGGGGRGGGGVCSEGGWRWRWRWRAILLRLTRALPVLPPLRPSQSDKKKERRAKIDW